MNDLIKFILIAVFCLGVSAQQSYGQSKRQRKKAEKAESAEKPAEPLLADARQKEAGESFFVDGIKFLMLEQYDKAMERFQC